METTFIIFLIACAAITASVVVSIFLDKSDPKQETLSQFFSGFFAAGEFKLAVPRWLVLVGLLLYTYVYLGIPKDSAVISTLMIEVTIIFIVIGVTSTLFNNYDNTDQGPSMNAIGILHLALLGIAVAGLVPTYLSKFLSLDSNLGSAADNLGSAVDIVAHLITFAVAFFGLMGETYDSNTRRLTKQGMASVILIFVFSGISIVSSLESSEKQQILDNSISALIEKSMKLNIDLEKANTQIAEIADVSKGIVSLPENVHQRVQHTLTPVMNAVNFNFDASIGTKKGFVTQTLFEVKDFIGYQKTVFQKNDSTLKEANLAMNKNQILFKDTRIQLDQNKSHFTSLSNRFVRATDSITVLQVARMEAKTKEAMKDLRDTQQSLKAVNSILLMQQSIKDIIDDNKGLDSASMRLTINKIEQAVRKF